MVKKILLGILILLIGLAFYISAQSSHYEISREILIQSSPETIFPYLANSEKANSWMPWIESDPQIKMNYSGPAEGLGSIATWESSGKMGVGQSLVTEVVVNQKVITALDYKKPMVMHQIAEFLLTPEKEGTKLKWSVKGENNFIGRLFCLFMNMDKMVGSEFEKGLSKLKKTVEKSK